MVIYGAARQTRGLAWQKSAPQGLNSPRVGTRSTINSVWSRGVSLVYQRFHTMAFKWFPCLFPKSQWHMCAQRRPAGCLRCCAMCSAAAGAGAACQPRHSPASASPVIDSCSPAPEQAAHVQPGQRQRLRVPSSGASLGRASSSPCLGSDV